LLVSSKTCPSGYVKIIDTASFKGDDGEAGPTGATGLNGTNGTNGTDGATGATGGAGLTGATGSTGPTGATGLNGTNGTDGATGSTGATGATGAQGVQGLTGATGSQGNAGLPAIAHSTCQKRHQQFVYVIDNTHRVISGCSKNCNSGEYAHAVNAVASYSYSNDWAYDIGSGLEPSDDAGTSGSYNNQQDSNELRQVANVFDAEDLFPIGYEVSLSMREYPLYQSIVGSLTLTYDITLTCCLLGD